MKKTEAQQALTELKAKSDELQKFIDQDESEWLKPENGTFCWFVQYDGEKVWFFWGDDEDDEFLLNTGNLFRTEQEAEQYKRRLLASKPKYLPEKGELYYTVYSNFEPADCKWKGDFIDLSLYWSGLTFYTEEECQAWINEYKDAFEIKDI